MGWKSISKSGEVRFEGHENPELGGRPVAQGEEGNLLTIIQEDYGHTIIIDLVGAIIYIDPDGYEIQDRLYVHNPKTTLWMAEDSSIVGEMANVTSTYDLKRDERGRKFHDENGKLVKVRTDTLTPLFIRPIWFSRNISTLPAPVKVVGLQATLPDGGNSQKMVMIYPDGRLGIY